jgi:ABC-type multidrug transport system fused ATPase/permease subunit
MWPRLSASARELNLAAWTKTVSGGLPQSIFGYVWQFSQSSQMWLCVGSVATFFLSLAPLELQRRIINEAFKDRDLNALVYLCGAYAVVALAMGLIKKWLNIYRGIVSERATWALRQEVHAVIEKEHSKDEKTKEGTTIAVAVAEVEPVGGFVGMAISEPLLQGGIMVFTFAYLVYIQPWMGLLSLVIFSPQFFFVPHMQAAINRRAAVRIRIMRKVGARLITEYEAPESGGDRKIYTRKITTVLELYVQIFKLKFAMNFYMNSLHHLGIVGVLLVGGWFVVDGRTDPGTILAFISGLGQLKEPWNDLVNYYREATTAQVKYRLVRMAVEDGPMPRAQAA